MVVTDVVEESIEQGIIVIVVVVVVVDESRCTVEISSDDANFWYGTVLLEEGFVVRGQDVVG